MLCGDLNGKEIQKRGNTCIQMADSLCCTAENNTTLYSDQNWKKEKSPMRGCPVCEGSGLLQHPDSPAHSALLSLRLPWSPVPGPFLGKMNMFVFFLVYSHRRKWSVMWLRDQHGASSGPLDLGAALQRLM